MDRNQKFLIWARRALIALYLIGSVAVIGLWWLYATTKCEGFGCIGLGALIFLLIAVGSANAVAGGLLHWMNRRLVLGPMPSWVWALEMLNLSPLAWLLFRMLFVK